MKLFPAHPSKPASAARQKLRAAVARRTARTPSIEEEEEPTTSFKTALVVVLLLHIVAGGGFVMFDRIKTRRPDLTESVPAKPQKAAVAAPSSSTAAVAQSAVARPKPTAAPVAAPAEAVKKPASAQSAAATAAEVKDSGAFYTVAKGDNPVAIARKLHVTYDDLLKLNKIDDPKKLRPGQKLHVPVKARASAN